MLTSKQVTAEAAVQWDGYDLAPVAAVVGDRLDASMPLLPVIVAADGRRMLLCHGDWAVRYGPRDCGVLSRGAHERYWGA